MDEDIKIGLGVIGLQDQQHLKSALMNCDDPLKAISEFQEENGILLPTLKPALPLLDLHNIKRLDFHQSVTDKLKDRLISRIEELSNTKASDYIEKLEDLLTRSFPVINIPRMTPLVMTIMKHLPNIDHRYLAYLMNREDYYSICPIEVKRQIWSLNTDLFYKELDPIFDKCLQHFEEQLVNFEFIQKSSTLIETTDKDQLCNLKWKRHSNYINEIVRMIGYNGKLYNQTVNYLIKLFMSTNNWFYASIRSLLLIKLTDVDDTSSSENIYKFTWSLNACIKERKIDTKRIKELEAIVDAKKFDKILLDVSFILADYFAIDSFCYSAICLLTKCVSNETLPRKCEELIFLLRILQYSISSRNTISNNLSSKELNIDVNVITSFLPYLAYLIADHQERLYEDTIETLNSSSEPTTPIVFSEFSKIESPFEQQAKIPNFTISEEKNQVIESIRQFNEGNELTTVLTLYYILECTETSDWVNLKHTINLVKYPYDNEGFEKWFLLQFITNISQSIDNFKQEWFSSLIFDDFLLKNLKSDAIYEMIYKYVDKLFTYLQPAVLFRILEELKPRKQSNLNIQHTYTKLRNRFDNMLQTSNKL